MNRSNCLCFLFCIFLTGCTLKGLIFDHLDWLIMQEMDEAFDLTDKQYETMRARLILQLKTAQKTTLPEIKKELIRIASLDRPLTEAEIRALSQKAWDLWYEYVNRLAEDAAFLLFNLDEKQWRHFEGYLERRKDDYRERVTASPKDYDGLFRELQDKRIERVEALVGEVTGEQREALYKVSYLDQKKSLEEYQLSNRVRDEFLKQVKVKKSEPGFSGFLKSWARHPGGGDEKAYQEFRKERTERSLRIWLTLEPMLNKEQLKFRRGKLKEFIEDVRKLEAVKF